MADGFHSDNETFALLCRLGIGYMASDWSKTKVCNFEPIPSFMCNVCHVKLIAMCGQLLSNKANASRTLHQCVQVELGHNYKKFDFCMLTFDGTVPHRLFCFIAVMMARTDGVIVITTHGELHEVLMATMQTLFCKTWARTSTSVVFKVAEPFFVMTRAGDLRHELWPNWTFILD